MTSVQPEDAQLTVLDRRQRREHAHQRRFTGTVGPEQTHGLTGPRLQRHVIDGGELAVAVGQVLAIDGRGSSSLMFVAPGVVVSSCENLQPLCQRFDLVVIQFVDTPDDSARRAALDASTICWVRPASTAQRRGDRSLRRCGSVNRRTPAWKPGSKRCWAPTRVRQRRR